MTEIGRLYTYSAESFKKVMHFLFSVQVHSINKTHLSYQFVSPRNVIDDKASLSKCVNSLV